MSDQLWIIVYPSGNRNQLSMAQCFDYEMSDYDRASQRQYSEGQKDECEAYMKHLSVKHGLPIKGTKSTAYLD